jgi:hypothetical protein
LRFSGNKAVNLRQVSREARQDKFMGNEQDLLPRRSGIRIFGRGSRDCVSLAQRQIGWFLRQHENGIMRQYFEAERDQSLW